MILPDLTHPKAVYFSDSDETSLILKALTAVYYERLLFVEFNQSQKEEVTQFQITRYPTLIVLRLSIDGTVDSIKYEGAFELAKINSFLDQHALRFRVPFTLNEFGENKPTV